MKAMTVHARSVPLILAATTLLAFSPALRADFTYLDDDVHPEMTWVDVERVGWDVDVSSNELILTVEYQEALPPCPPCICEYAFDGYFYFDTDQDLTTGYPLENGAPRGTDYELRIFHRSLYEGEGYGFASLHRWDEAEEEFVAGAEMKGPTLSPEGDAMTIAIEVADLDSPSAVDVIYTGFGQYDDLFSIPASVTTYDIGSDDRDITVDGDDVDWRGASPFVTDLEDDLTPGWMDASNVYVADSATTERLYLRLDLSSAPLTLHPEEASSVRQNIEILFDMDGDASTGEPWFGIGAEYKIRASMETDHASQTLHAMVLSWNAASGRLEWDELASDSTEVAMDTSLELGVRRSDLGVAEPGSTVPVTMTRFHTKPRDRVPNVGAFTVDLGGLSASGHLSTMTAFGYFGVGAASAAVAILLVMVLFRGTRSSGHASIDD
ncbi:MAG: hypothetical protein OEM62_02880 [Acidobacteriota bacterium]|nr:hypothetical protein [Acidobacteriota bacterium]